MADRDRLAALLHIEWDYRAGEPSEPGVPCKDCAESADRLIAAGVGFHDDRPRLCGCKADASLGASSVCPACGHRDHGRSGCHAALEADR